jgi:hypothetical protein
VARPSGKRRTGMTKGMIRDTIGKVFDRLARYSSRKSKAGFTKRQWFEITYALESWAKTYPLVGKLEGMEERALEIANSLSLEN